MNWIKVSDGLPKENEATLAHCASLKVTQTATFTRGKFYTLWDGVELINVTHWTQLQLPQN